ncbi:MAG: hypothetical protein ACREQP_02590, partial [Candidatus Binatia bacterium]
MSSKRKFLSLLISMSLSLLVTAVGDTAFAAQLQLSWHDNSTNENGFKVERSTSANGNYSQIAQTGANVTSYT